MRLRRSVFAAMALVAVPLPALAHGVGGRLDLPVPLAYFIAGAATVLLLTFAALTALWPRPRLQGGVRMRPVSMRLMAPVSRIANVVGVVVLILVIVAGPVQMMSSSGEVPISPVLVWVWFWLAVPFVSVVAGDVYSELNPWRTLGRWLGIGTVERAEAGDRLGVWPASGLFLAFAWLELIWPASAGPMSLAVATMIYTVAMLAAMAHFGRDTALASFDLFTVYNRLFSSIAPWGRSDAHTLQRRGWLRALPVLPEWRGLWAFVVTAIGTVTFDGLAATSWWPTTSMWASTLGMLGVVAVVGGCYLGACRWAAASAGSSSALEVAQRFAHTLVPIGVAYALAHYFSLVIFEGQQLFSTISDPFGLGWNLFGTAERKIDFFTRRPEPIWYLQIAVVVGGHVLGVVMSHDRALVDFEGDEAIRSEYALLGLMVLLTGLGLAILAG